MICMQNQIESNQARRNWKAGRKLPPAPTRGARGQKVPSNQQKIVLSFAQYKSAYSIVTAVETELQPCLLYFVFSQEFKIKITDFFGGEGDI